MDKSKKSQIESYLRAYNQFDLNGMLGPLAQDVIFQHYSQGTLTHHTEGLAAFRQQAEAAMDLFRSREQTAVEWSFDENVVTVHISYYAVLAADLPNGLQAGQVLRLKGQSVFHFTGNHITKIIDRS